MATNMNAPGPWNNFNPSSVPVELQQATYDNYSYNGPVNASQPQINPAGVSSADGMMTLPAMQLYPGEKLGIDGVPYRPDAGQTNPAYDYEPNQGSSAAASSTPVANVLGTRQFNQRTPSGSVYAPDMSAYNDSSLFNYTGQGGVPEYTYGQGLRTDGSDYSIWGSPANAANPYFEGQFAKSAGPADAAINMNPVVMPVGIPAIGGGSGSTFTPAPSGITPRPGSNGLTPQQAAQAMAQAGQDLTYQQTIDEMGIFGPNNPPPSTQFPSPGGVVNNPAQAPQLSPQQLAILADQDRMQQGQISPTIQNAAQNIFNPNEQINAAGVSSPDGMMTMPTQPTAMQNYMDDSQSASGVTDRTAEIMAYAKANNNMIDGVTVLDDNDPRKIFQDAILNPTKRVEPQPVMGGLDGTPYPFSGMPPERDTFKADEIDISTPFVPEGQEGVDYWQSTTGEFFNMEDDMGTQALGPVDPFAGMPPERGFFKTDEAGIDKPATLPSYEADGDIESTSNNMGALDNSYAAIDAKYEGSTTNESQLAKLKEVIAATNNEYGGSGSTNARGSRGDTVPADIPAFLGQNISRMADKYIPSPAETDYPPAYPSYAIEDEGTSTGESLFQGVSEVPSDSQYQYDGAYENAAGSDAAIDAVVKQQEAQQAQVQKTKAKAAAKAKSDAAAKVKSDAAAKAKSDAAAKAKSDAVKKEKADTAARILKLEAAKEKAAAAKAKSEAQAKAKAAQARSKAAARAKSEAAAKAKAEAAARARAADAAEARRNPPAKPKPKKVKVSYNRNKPTPVKKSKPTPRGPKPSKPTRSTGSRGGRGNVSRRRRTGGR